MQMELINCTCFVSPDTLISRGDRQHRNTALKTNAHNLTKTLHNYTSHSKCTYPHRLPLAEKVNYMYVN